MVIIIQFIRWLWSWIQLHTNKSHVTFKTINLPEIALFVQSMIVYNILQCARGHVVCSDCRPNVSTCPQVRQKSIRHYVHMSSGKAKTFVVLRFFCLYASWVFPETERKPPRKFFLCIYILFFFFSFYSSVAVLKSIIEVKQITMHFLTIQSCSIWNIIPFCLPIFNQSFNSWK